MGDSCILVEFPLLLLHTIYIDKGRGKGQPFLGFSENRAETNVYRSCCNVNARTISLSYLSLPLSLPFSLSLFLPFFRVNLAALCCCSFLVWELGLGELPVPNFGRKVVFLLDAGYCTKKERTCFAHMRPWVILALKVEKSFLI